MLFSDPGFVFLFLPSVFIVFYLFYKYWTKSNIILLLIFSSILFYAAEYTPYILLIIGSILFNYYTSQIVETYRERTRWPLILGISANLVLLGWFKYAAFIADNLGRLFITDIDVPDIILPLAISFFTFQQIAYLVDVQRGDIKTGDLRTYALFVMFFPQLIAGPIVRYQEVVPQFSRLHARLKDRMGDIALGASFFAIGLFKKNFVADELSLYGDPVFNAAHAGQIITFGETWTAVLAFSFQIYFDFSAYSDMAIGLARMFGITLPLNFNSPYKATSIIEFWRRWHMTLSRFLRDYLYFPLGGSRRGIPVHILSVMTVMLLGGLWHGAAWSFMLWGGIHGVLILVNHAYRRANKFIPPAMNPLRLTVVCWGLTFFATTFAWVPFRAADLDTTLLVWRTLLGLENLYLPYLLEPIFGQAGMWTIQSAVFDNAIYHGVLQSLGLHGGLPILPIAALICFCLPNSQQWLESETKKPHASGAVVIDRLKAVVSWRPNIAWATILCCAGFYALAQNKNPQTFVYFQF